MSHGPVFIVGIWLFFLGVITSMVAMFANGGMQKSQQFRVIGEIASGKAGRGARIALFVGLASALVGMCTTFAGVAQSDRARARKCAATCHARGYENGNIRASTATQPTHKNRAAFVACACTRGPAPDPLELRADSL